MGRPPVDKGFEPNDSDDDETYLDYVEFGADQDGTELRLVHEDKRSLDETDKD